MANLSMNGFLKKDFSDIFIKLFGAFKIFVELAYF